MKRGISLIAVLMFMLAATTASIVIFRWLGSENFASGARLKQTEAYKAAESGVEAAQAWLSNNGADVGAVLKTYLKQPTTSRKPILLTGQDPGENNILGIMHNDAAKQKFDVYLMGVDNTNTTKQKFKFLSIGTSRADGSEVRLSAVFDVSGLYQLQVPSGYTIPEKEPADYDYAYYGSNINFDGSRTFRSMAVSGDWTGNPPTVPGDFVVTGNLLVSGSEINVGGTLCVGGKFNADNNANVQDVYIGSSSNFIGTYNNVYSEGSIKIGSAFPTNINGSLGINNGSLTFNDSRDYLVRGSLSLENNSYVDGGASSLGNNNSFVVCNTVWSNNASGVVSPSGNASKIRLATGPSGSVNSPSRSCESSSGSAILAFRNATGGPTSYSTENSGGYFTSPQTNHSPSSENKPKTADAPKNYCYDKWRPATSSGCSGSNFVIDDPIGAALADIETAASNSPACAKGSDGTGIYPIMNGGTSAMLNNCYNTNKTNPNLYNGYLIIKWKAPTANNNPYPNSKESSNAAGLNGKFIFLYTWKPEYVYVYPTTAEGKVMMFLKEGVSKELRSSRCNSANNPYNYFIYSLKTIYEANDWDTNCPLTGSLFFPSESCAGLTKANNGFKADINTDLFRDLVNNQILCKGVNCAVGGGGSGGGGGMEITWKNDDNWIPTSSRLKVSLAGKNISRETRPSSSNKINATGSVLAMPRVVRLTKDAFGGDTPPTLEDFYTLMYLNNAEQAASKPIPTCNSMSTGGGTMPTSGLLTEDVFECAFGNANISKFYVIVKGESGGSTVRLSNNPTEITANSTAKSAETCRDVEVIAVKGKGNQPGGISATINISNKVGSGWTISSSSISGCGISPSSSSEGPWTITCNTFKEKMAKFVVCSENAEDRSLTLNISGSSGPINIDISNRQSTVSRNRKNLHITRTGYATNPSTDFVSCPNKGNDWVNLTCSKGNITGNVTLDWDCDLIDGQSATYTITLPNHCELPSGVPSSSDIPEVSTAAANSSSSASFQLDLNWKSYTVTLDVGGTSVSTVNLVTDNTSVPSDKRNLTCSAGSSTCEVYHGATYSITHSGTQFVDITCSPYSCAGYSYINNQRAATLTPQATTTITLSASSANEEETEGCNYNKDWCGGSMGIISVLPSTKPNQGECSFISDFSVISPNTNSTVSINGVANTCGSSYCINNNKPPKADGGYYVYVSAGSINAWQGVQTGTKPTEAACATGQISISCNRDGHSNSYFIGENIPRPNVICNGVQSVDYSPRFTGQFGEKIDGINDENWGNSQNGAATQVTKFLTPGVKSIYLNSMRKDCGKTSASPNMALAERIHCGDITINCPSNNPSCGGSVEKVCTQVTDGNIYTAAPNDCFKFKCNGKFEMVAYNPGATPKMRINLSGGCSKTDEEVYTSGSNPPTNYHEVCNSTGELTIETLVNSSAVRFTCDGIGAPIRCSAPNIGLPNANSTCYKVMRPNVTCPGTATAGTATFYYDNSSANILTQWNDNPGLIREFCNAGTRPIHLSELKCNDTPVTINPPVECGALKIPKCEDQTEVPSIPLNKVSGIYSRTTGILGMDKVCTPPSSNSCKGIGQQGSEGSGERCFKIASCDGQLKFDNSGTGAGEVTLKITSKNYSNNSTNCSNSSYKLPAGSSWVTPTGTPSGCNFGGAGNNVYIEVENGTTKNFNVGCF